MGHECTPDCGAVWGWWYHDGGDGRHRRAGDRPQPSATASGRRGAARSILVRMGHRPRQLVVVVFFDALFFVAPDDCGAFARDRRAGHDDQAPPSIAVLRYAKDDDFGDTTGGHGALSGIGRDGRKRGRGAASFVGPIRSGALPLLDRRGPQPSSPSGSRPRALTALPVIDELA